MKLLSVWEIDHGAEANRVELLEGDLAHLPPEHAVDVLVVSAFKDNFAEIPGTLIGALARRGISVGELATRKRVDLRDQFSCWLSQPVDPKFGFRFVLCIESGWKGQPPEITDDIFRALAPLLFTDLANASVAMPLIGAGSQGYPPAAMLKAIVASTVGWMRRGLKLRTLKIVVQSAMAQDMLRVFEALRSQDAERGNRPELTGKTSYDVFISYAHDNRSCAELFINQIKQASRALNIFVYGSSIGAGNGWPIAIANALDASRKVVVLHSEAYWASNNCKSEFNAAFARQNDLPVEDIAILYPLVLDDVKIPYMFRTMQYLDCRQFDPGKIASASLKLCQSLSG